MITQDRLKEVLDYDPVSGIFRWKIKTSDKVIVGNIAGCVRKNRHTVIKIDKMEYTAHRLVWLYMYGSFPEKELDHINCIRGDNRLCNLREVTRSQNLYNRAKFPNTKSGHKGVYYNKAMKKWRARIGVEGKSIDIGFYSTIEEAISSYQNAAIKYHGEYARIE